ncbi:hypothetical protein AWW72_18070 [Acinetobacter sp. NRRL B-65365]|uniref:hypothetical protein n=1 Tax=Acinetobacter sp. NRRL B-65365 TaxID=1785092 RepID=UPI0007A0610F|nr:hypothetical protein [Acinetobacter sp. NRRL B-65365]KYQ82513.1 hypothetical protein AWW72_18070 [Acinetobacter sp. NRRL B-65365]
MSQIIYRAEDYILKACSNSIYRIEKVIKGKKTTKIRISNQKTKSESTISLSAIERKATWEEVRLKRRVLEVDQIDPAITFTGKMTFGDASMCIQVDRPSFKSWSEEEAHWNSQLHIQVFNTVLTELSNLGYSIKQQTNIFTSPDHKYCRKGDLRLDVEVENGCVVFHFYQNVNAPNRPDHGGRYEHNQQKLMPYLMLLEMKRTRNRIKKLFMECYGFTFEEDFKRKSRFEIVGPEGLTALEWIEEDYKADGITLEKLEASSYGYTSEYNNQSADKKRLVQGLQVWFYERKKRLNVGKVYYRSNSMWWVVTGKYGYAIESSNSLYVEKPHDVRIKANQKTRRNILSQVIFDAKNKGNLAFAEKIQALFDSEFNDKGLFITREQARKYFTQIGLNFGHITLARIRKLHALLDERLKASGIFDKSLRCHKNISFQFTDEGGMAHALIKCDANYFTGRQAVEFEENGFIGFAGWSDEYALKPMLEAFVEWCDLTKKEVAA